MTYDKDISEEKFQVTSYKTNEMELQIISIYRSQNWSSARLFEEIKKMLDHDKNTLIVGDFNICFKENYSNQLIQGLLKIGFVQLIHEPTHTRVRIIDHAL